MPQQPALTVDEQKLNDVWNEHLRAEFSDKYFLPQIPPDTEVVPVSRTIGQGRLVDEIVVRFTHTIPMDWMLPGIPPTGKRVEVGLVVVVQFDGDKMAHETLYWDQASVL